MNRNSQRTLPLLMIVLWGMPALGQDGARPISGRYAFLAQPDGHESLLVMSDTGGYRSEIPLDEHTVVDGAGRIGLLSRATTSAGRQLRLLDDDAAVVASFFVAADRNVVLSDRTVALVMNNDHSTGRPMLIDFVTPTGQPLSHYEDPGVTLLRLDGHANGRFVAQAAARSGQVFVYAFDARGLLSWRVRAGSNATAHVALAPSGTRAAIAHPDAESGDWSLSLIDAQGNPLGDSITHPLSQLLFSPDDSLLVVGGDSGVSIHRSSDGSLTHRIERAWSLAGGTALAFSADGTELLVLASPRDEDGQATDMRLHVLSRVQDFAQRLSVAVDRFDGAAAVLTLAATPAGARVTTTRAVHLVSFTR